MNIVFHAIWFKHGANRNNAIILGLTRAANIYVLIWYISEEKFMIDIDYLFSALKQSLVNRRTNLIEKEDVTTNDGIVILHNLYTVY